MKIQKRKDIWLILAVILIVAALMAAITLFRPDLGSRAAVQIKVDGQEIGTYPLQENREIPVHTEYGYNLIVIQDGAVFVREADCGNQDCVQQGAMSPVSYTHLDVYKRQVAARAWSLRLSTAPACMKAACAI